MNDLISVIVPVYNVEIYLKRCVDSIIGQTYKNLEIILVDDGSTDNSPRICDELASLDNRIKVLHKSNGGLSSARNYGLLQAKGNYLGFVDSDDYIREDMYERLLEKLIEYNADIIKSDFLNFSDDNKVLCHIGTGKVTVYDSEYALNDFIFTSFSATKHMKSTVWDGLYKRELFLKEQIDGKTELALPFPVGKINEDTYIFPDLLLAANTIIHIEESFYFYYIRENSISHSLLTIREIESRTLWKEIHFKLLQRTNKYAQKCVYNWVCRYIGLIDKLYNSDYKNEYFQLVLDELLNEKQYLLQNLSDKRIIRTLKIIHKYKLYRLAKKYLHRFFY